MCCNALIWSAEQIHCPAVFSDLPVMNPHIAAVSYGVPIFARKLASHDAYSRGDASNVTTMRFSHFS
jgi:hypothetical protein